MSRTINPYGTHTPLKSWAPAEFRSKRKFPFSLPVSGLSPSYGSQDIRAAHAAHAHMIRVQSALLGAAEYHEPASIRISGINWGRRLFETRVAAPVFPK